LLIDGHWSYLDTLCQALSGDETCDGFEAVPADHGLYDPEAQQYFAPLPPFQAVRPWGPQQQTASLWARRSNRDGGI
jgi:hypothetical protein